MSDKRLETSPNPAVTVLAQGRLYIRGWDEQAVEAICATADCSVVADGDVIKVNGQSRLDVRVPFEASIEVTGFGEVTLRDLRGSVQIRQVGGSLNLREVGAVLVESVGDDLNAQDVNGELSVRQVGRHMSVRGVSGALRADFVSAHANVKDVGGDVHLESGGNVNLLVDASEAKQVNVKSDGVITCRVQPGLNAAVSINSYGPISIKVGETRETIQDGHFEMAFGDGEGAFSLNADGPVSLLEAKKEKESPGFDFSTDIGQELGGIGGLIGEQISGHLEMISEELGARMAGLSDLVDLAGDSAGNAEEISSRTQEKIARAQEKIRRAQARAARRIADAQRRAQARSRREEQRGRRGPRGKSFTIDLSDLKKSAKSQSEPVSDEERLLILNMVAEKKITLEEAEALLSALEGK